MDYNLINPLVLAYLGDAIYELLVRRKLVEDKYNKVNDLQKECTKFVSANGQSKFVRRLIDKNILNEVEIEVYKRGRNTKVNSHPKNTSIIIYKEATGLECLFGYLYINKNYERMKELIDILMGE